LIKFLLLLLRVWFSCCILRVSSCGTCRPHLSINASYRRVGNRSRLTKQLTGVTMCREFWLVMAGSVPYEL